MATATQSTQDFLPLPLKLIDCHPDNPRQQWHVEELAVSVEDVGVLQPPIVRPTAGGRYQLVAGARRLRAARSAGHKEVVCAVRELTDGDALVYLLVENFQRQDFNSLEQALALARLCAPTSDGGAGLTQQEAARRIGRTQPTVSNLIRLLKLPEAWQQRLANGELNEPQARALVAHAADAEFLDGVEKDMAANPWAWRTSDDFERNVKLLKAAETTRSRRSPRAACAPQRGGAASIAGDIGAAASAPQSMPKDVNTICVAIRRLPTMAAVRRIQRAIDKRRAELLK